MHSYLVDIEMAADRARDLTQQLLAYAGKGRFALESIDLSEVVREVTNLLDVSSPKGSNDVSTFGKTCPQSAETVRSYTRSS